VLRGLFVTLPVHRPARRTPAPSSLGLFRLPLASLFPRTSSEHQAPLPPPRLPRPNSLTALTCPQPYTAHRENYILLPPEPHTTSVSSTVSEPLHRTGSSSYDPWSTSLDQLRHSWRALHRIYFTDAQVHRCAEADLPPRSPSSPPTATAGAASPTSIAHDLLHRLPCT
jgi:hypothetical protein